jgi:hypothetical protein
VSEDGADKEPRVIDAAVACERRVPELGDGDTVKDSQEDLGRVLVWN